MKFDHFLTHEEQSIITRTSKSFNRRHDWLWIVGNFLLALLTLTQIGTWMSVVLFHHIDSRAVGFVAYENMDNAVPAYYVVFCRALHFSLFIISVWITIVILRRGQRKRDQILMKLWQVNEQSEIKDARTPLNQRNSNNSNRQ
jgi:hypothetical protein